MVWVGIALYIAVLGLVGGVAAVGLTAHALRRERSQALIAGGVLLVVVVLGCATLPAWIGALL